MKYCQRKIMSVLEVLWGLVASKAGGCSITSISALSVSTTPAKSRENKESKMQVNKLIDDLRKQLLQQGKKQSHIGFSGFFIPSL